MKRTLLLAIAWSAVCAGAGTSASAPTFTKHVPPSFHRKCTACHRMGEVAPMELLTYANGSDCSAR